MEKLVQVENEISKWDLGVLLLLYHSLSLSRKDF